MSESVSEKELVLKCLKGDNSAFEKLLEDHKPRLRSSMLSSFNKLTMEDFEDCWQNTALKAFQNLKNFREDSSFKTWLYVILKNEIILFVKHKNIQESREIHLDRLIDGMESDNLGEYDLVSNIDTQLVENAATIIEKRERIEQYKKLIDNALSKLEPNHSEILTMVLVDGKSYKEVADTLKIPIGTVMSRLHFARKKMQKTISNYARTSNIQLPTS